MVRCWSTLLAGLFLSLVCAVACSAQTVYPDKQWERRDPAELGMDPDKLELFAQRVGGSGCVIKDGYLVYAWGDQDEQVDWFSAAKPVLSTLLMFAVNEGKLASVDAPVGDYWPLSQKDQGMTFRHLADMTSGYMRAEKPGQAWAYNDYGISLYVQTLRKVFGQTLEEAIRQRMGALQFQSERVFSEDSNRHGGRLVCTPQDFARIGWFWLNKGKWKDQQLLPAQMFDTYCRVDVPADMPRTRGDETENYLGIKTYGGGHNQTKFGPGIYGFNWWFNAYSPIGKATLWPTAPADTFQANGRWGTDVMTIFPSLKMVVVGEGEWGRFEPGEPIAQLNQNLRLLVEAANGPTAKTDEAAQSQPATKPK